MVTLLTSAMLAMGAMVALGVPASAAPARVAEGCVIICGGVSNDTSSYTMRYTRALGTNDAGHVCDVWNWDGGNTWKWKDNAKCGQRDLSPGDSRGGTGSRFDVDAFTFASNRYKVTFNGGITWRTLDQGVWTKIHSNEYATCFQGSGGVPQCKISE